MGGLVELSKEKQLAYKKIKKPKNQIDRPFKKVKERTVWENFSRSVRLSYAIKCEKFESPFGWHEIPLVCCCVTCKSVKRIIDIDCGHFIQRNKKATKYDRKNNHPQCKRCNDKRYGAGEQAKYAEYLDYKYGKGTAQSLLNKSRIKCKLSAYDLFLINEESKEIIKEKLKEFSIKKWW